MVRQEHCRRLDPAERFFWLADRVSCRNFVMLAELEGDIARAPLERALAAQLSRHEALRWRFQADQPLVSTEPVADCRIGLREATASGNDWRATIAAELAMRFAPGQVPLLRCTLLHLPAAQASVLALTFHHSLADGRSAAALMRSVLNEVLDGTVSSAGAQTSMPPLHALFPEGKGPAKAGKGTGKGKDSAAQEDQRLARLQSTLPAARPRLETIVLDREQTGHLRAQCRAEETTMQGALGAAQLLATRAILGPSPDMLLLTNAVDMRSYLKQSVPSDQLGLYTSLLSASYEVKAEAGDFWPLARRIAEDLRQQIARGEAYHFYSLARLFFSLQPPDEALGGGEGRRSRPSHSMLTNVGIIPEVEGRGRVKAISFALAPMPSQLSVCAAATYGGRLQVNLSYNSVVLSPTDAGRMARLIQTELSKAAGLAR
jgi:hypothetical protein